ncbi:MAG: hypothetical protein WB664_00610, partial [Nitrososphaeraceae archaeon]
SRSATYVIIPPFPYRLSFSPFPVIVSSAIVPYRELSESVPSISLILDFSTIPLLSGFTLSFKC